MSSTRTNEGTGLSILVGILFVVAVALSGLLGAIVLQRTSLTTRAVVDRLDGATRPVRRFVGRMTSNPLAAAVGRASGSPEGLAGSVEGAPRRDLMLTENRGTADRSLPAASAPAVGGLRAGDPGETSEEPPRESPAGRTGRTAREWMRLLDTLRRHSDSKGLGNRRAPLTMVAYLDLTDPYSARHLKTVLPVLARRYVRSDTLFYRVRHRPMDNLHPRGVAAANAAECAARQGVFWRFTVLAALNRDRLSEGELIRIGRRAGVHETDEFRRCVKGRKQLARVKREGEVARGIGVHSTPTLRLEDRLMAGPTRVSQLERVIRHLRN